MLTGLLSDVLGILLGLAFLLFLLNYRWFVKYLNLIYALVYIPLFYLTAFLFALPSILFTALKGLPKAVATVILSLLIAVLYLLPLPIPLVGKYTQNLNKRLESHIDTSIVQTRTDEVRSKLVEIVAEHGDDPLEFDDEEQYREELVQLRENAKKRLEIGESISSLTVGGLLVVSQLYDVSIFTLRLGGFPVTFLIELYLLMVAISIVYRVTILDLLAYDGSEEFETLREMDAAVAYQKGVSLVKVVQGLLLLMVAVTIMTYDKFKVAVPVIRKQYAEDLSRWEVLLEAWREWKDHRADLEEAESSSE